MKLIKDDPGRPPPRPVGAELNLTADEVAAAARGPDLPQRRASRSATDYLGGGLATNLYAVGAVQPGARQDRRGPARAGLPGRRERARSPPAAGSPMSSTGISRADAGDAPSGVAARPSHGDRRVDALSGDRPRRSIPASSSASSGRRAAARPRCSSCSPGSSTRPTGTVTIDGATGRRARRPTAASCSSSRTCTRG